MPPINPTVAPQRIDHTETLDMLRDGILGRTFIESRVVPMVENLVARLGDEDAIAQLKVSHEEITKQAAEDRKKATDTQRTYDDLISDPNRLTNAIGTVVRATATVTEDGKRRLEKMLEEFNLAWHEEAVGRLGAELVRAAEAQDALRRQEADELAKSQLDPATQALLASSDEGQMPGQQKLPGMS